MHLIGRDAISLIIRYYESVSEFNKDPFEGEAVGGCLGIRTDGIVADQDHAFGFLVTGKHDLTGERDRVPVDIDALVGTDDLDDLVLVAVLQQLLIDSSTGDAAGLEGTGIFGRFFGRWFGIVGPLAERCSIG